MEGYLQRLPGTGQGEGSYLEALPGGISRGDCRAYPGPYLGEVSGIFYRGYTWNFYLVGGYLEGLLRLIGYLGSDLKLHLRELPGGLMWSILPMIHTSLLYKFTSGEFTLSHSLF